MQIYGASRMVRRRLKAGRRVYDALWRPRQSQGRLILRVLRPALRDGTIGATPRPFDLAAKTCGAQHLSRCTVAGKRWDLLDSAEVRLCAKHQSQRVNGESWLENPSRFWCVDALRLVCDTAALRLGAERFCESQHVGMFKNDADQSECVLVPSIDHVQTAAELEFKLWFVNKFVWKADTLKRELQPFRANIVVPFGFMVLRFHFEMPSVERGVTDAGAGLCLAILHSSFPIQIACNPATRESQVADRIKVDRHMDDHDGKCSRPPTLDAGEHEVRQGECGRPKMHRLCNLQLLANTFSLRACAPEVNGRIQMPHRRISKKSTECVHTKRAIREAPKLPRPDLAQMGRQSHRHDILGKRSPTQSRNRHGSGEERRTRSKNPSEHRHRGTEHKGSENKSDDWPDFRSSLWNLGLASHPRHESPHRDRDDDGAYQESDDFGTHAVCSKSQVSHDDFWLSSFFIITPRNQ